jgi:hypothetical protein
MIQVWSCGGGTQSAAIAALIIQGRIERPAYSVMVDTEREKSSTWRFVDGVLKPRLAEVGVDLVVVSKSKYATVDLNCKTLVREVFGVDPPRSSCWMCPHMGEREWMELRDHYPEDFARAVALEAEIRERDPHAFLHRSGKPLIQIADQIGVTDQIELLGCDSGMCFV